ncbi:hypothetical protein [Actinomadura harenae]|uniref:Uncharacterized protein n=1 Tax=Actinomadura harenae TaxID=2483351 RepID=A0A3M2M6K1_9ACTN|nr:hypothetical protein [Actinomadura harenae]RMI45434.1 hypothetical protein EBO15_09435 [Actinomadura harenae]
MPLPGSRTKSTDLWLLPPDEELLDAGVDRALPGAGWMCSHPGPVGLHQVHLHRTVRQAMECGGRQAFIPLPARASLPETAELTDGVEPRSPEPLQAIVQLLRSDLYEDEHGEHFRAGRLAVRWFEPEVGPALHAVLTEQTRLLWRALRTATQPAPVIDQFERRTSGARIGPAAREMVLDQVLPLTRGGWARFRLV